MSENDSQDPLPKCHVCSKPGVEERGTGYKGAKRPYCEEHLEWAEIMADGMRKHEKSLDERFDRLVGEIAHNNHALLVSEGAVDQCKGCRRVMRRWPFGGSSDRKLRKTAERLVRHMNEAHGKSWVVAPQNTRGRVEIHRND